MADGAVSWPASRLLIDSFTINDLGLVVKSVLVEVGIVMFVIGIR